MSGWIMELIIELMIGLQTDLIIDCVFERMEQRQEIKYDKAVLATGSYPFVPPTPGVDKKGVFVYRTIDDLEVRED